MEFSQLNWPELEQAINEAQDYDTQSILRAASCLAKAVSKLLETV